MKRKKSGIKKDGKIVKERIKRRRGRGGNWGGYREGRRDLE